MAPIEQRILQAGDALSDITVEPDPISVAAARARIASDRVVALQMQMPKEQWVPEAIAALVMQLVELGGTLARSHNDLIGAGLGEDDVVLAESRLKEMIAGAVAPDEEIVDEVARDPLLDGLVGRVAVTVAPLRLAKTPRAYFRHSADAVAVTGTVAERFERLAAERRHERPLARPSPDE